MGSNLVEAIIYQRKLKGLTQKKLGELSGLSQSYLWRVENEEGLNPSFNAIIKIAHVLEMSLDQLVFGEPAPNEAEQFLKEFNNLDDISKKGILAQMKELNRLKE